MMSETKGIEVVTSKNVEVCFSNHTNYKQIYDLLNTKNINMKNLCKTNFTIIDNV